MSLEASVAAQTATVQDLIDNFSAKKAEIDTAVSNAIAAVPSLKYIFYLDAISGSDTNSGSQYSPFKTIKKACDSVPTGGTGHFIALDTAQEFVIDSSIVLNNKIIMFNSNIWKVKFLAKATIEIREGSSLINSHTFLFNLSESTISPFSIFGGSLEIGGFYSSTITSMPSSSLSLVKISHHQGDNTYGTSISRIKLSIDASIGTSASTPFYLIRSNSIFGAMAHFVYRNMILGANVAMFHQDLHTLQVGTARAYTISN